MDSLTTPKIAMEDLLAHRFLSHGRLLATILLCSLLAGVGGYFCREGRKGQNRQWEPIAESVPTEAVIVSGLIFNEKYNKNK